ncbi:MAG: HAMP domain-containing histidine kinase [Patescibacteria group bacterium]|nr:HAMP domain-containing histidine kinase [Patescibacteria group bacterium]
MKTLIPIVFCLISWSYIIISLLNSETTLDLILRISLLVVSLILGIITLNVLNGEINQNRRLSDLISFVSHQIKSPMTIAKDYAEIIVNNISNVEESTKNYASKIKENITISLNLIEEFLDYKKLEEGKIDFNFEKTEIVAFIKEIFDRFSILAQNKNLQYFFEAEIKEAFVNIDKFRLSQVIQNLIDNAIKYTEKGWVKLTLSTNANWLIICVSDSGIGISKEMQGKLFKKFERDPYIKGKIKGTGLGLYISKQIIDAHKGQIWAESEGEGKGSKFYVKIPISQS